MAIKKTGRPTAYSDEQVAAALVVMKARGEAITAASVKEFLVTAFDVSSGINIQSVEKAVWRVKAAQDAREVEERIAALPEGTRARIDGFAADLAEATLALVAGLHEGLRCEAETELALARREKEALAQAMEKAESALAVAIEQKTKSETRAMRQAEELLVLRQRVEGLEAELARTRLDRAFMDRLEAIIGQAALAVAEPDGGDRRTQEGSHSHS